MEVDEGESRIQRSETAGLGHREVLVHAHVLPEVVVPREVFATARVRALMRYRREKPHRQHRARTKRVGGQLTFLVRVYAANVAFQMLTTLEALIAPGNLALVTADVLQSVHH